MIIEANKDGYRIDGNPQEIIEFLIEINTNSILSQREQVGFDLTALFNQIAEEKKKKKKGKK